MTEPLDLDALRLDDVLAGALRGRPVTVLGLARSGLALTRFLADAGARVTVYDGRTGARAGRCDRGTRRPRRDARPRTRASTRPRPGRAPSWSPRRPSITPYFPTTEPSLRAALQDLVDEARGGRPVGAAARVGGGPVPAPLSRADDRDHGTKGKTTTASLTAALLAADPSHPVVLGGNIGVPMVERLPELTPAPPRRRRALGAPAADAVARDDDGGLHERDLGPPRPARDGRGGIAG